MKRFVSSLLAAGVAACGPAAEPGVVSTQAMAVSAIRFESVSGGTVPGFDLDGVDSPDGDGRTCGHADFTDPAGQRGVDNQFSTIFALMDAVAPGAVTSLVQQNIDDGLLLVLVELLTYEDGQVEVVLRSTSGDPLLGTDGALLDRQTFELSRATEVGRTRKVQRTSEGDVLAGPFDIALEITIFARLYRMTMEQGFLRYRLGADDTIQKGLIGGAVPVEELLRSLDEASAAAEADYRTLFAGLIEDTADMRVMQGKCRSLSAAFTLDLVSAFTAQSGVAGVQ